MPEFLERAVSFMDSNPHIGLAGTKITNPDGTLQESISYRYPGEKYTTDELSGLPGSIACVLGASMTAGTEAIIQSVFKNLENDLYSSGLVEIIELDTEYLHYGEDVR